MPSIVDSKIGTAFADTDWEQYVAGRPAYSPRMIQMINDYCTAHGTGSHRMVDIGGGVGVASLAFVSSFDIVHVSDPSPLNTAKAPQFIQDWLSRSGHSPTTVETSACKGEDAWQHIAGESVDLVISGTAAHFMDPDKFIDSAARILKPKGTLAVFSYFLPTLPHASEEHLDCLFACFSAIMCESTQTDGDDSAWAAITRLVRNITTGDGIYDFLPLKTELFDDPVRCRFNAQASHLARNKRAASQMLPNVEPGPSRIGEADKWRDYVSPKDPEADEWASTVTKDQIYALMDSMRGKGRSFTPQEKEQEPYKSWEAIFDRECPDGKVDLLYPAVLLMANKKS